MTRKPSPPISTDDLHGYADGQLPPGRAAEVEAYIAAHPSAARQVEDYRAINAALHRALDGVLDEPIPAAHMDVAQRRRPRPTLAVAALVASLLIGLAGGWFLNDRLSADRLAIAELAGRATAAYLVYAPEKRHPVEVSAADSDHLKAWLSNRMGMTFRLPRLSELGFALVGGRLMAGNGTPAALLMYEDAGNRRLVLYVSRNPPVGGQPDMRYRRDAEAGVVYWTDGATGFGISGNFSESELMPAAQVVRAQFSGI